MSLTASGRAGQEAARSMATRLDATSAISRGAMQEREWAPAITGAVLLALILILPPAVYYLAGVASHATGTVAASLILLFILFDFINAERAVAIAIGILAIGLHLLVAGMFVPIAYSRAAGSLVILILMVVAAEALGRWIFRLPDVGIRRSVALVRWLMIAAALWALLGPEPAGSNPWAKPIFPFTEPSHFALAFTPLMIDACVRNPGWRRVAWLLAGFGLAYYLESLSLLVGVLVAAACSVPLMKPLPWLIVAACSAFFFNLPYFAERLDIDGYSSSFGTNISVLIYLQGWELVVDSFDQTGGWGLGFQQLGLGVVNSPAAERIYRLVQYELNLQDGGLLAVKLIAEFGVLGIAAVLSASLLAIFSGLRLRSIAAGAQSASSGNVFALAIICGFTVNMFVRGVSYFSGTTLLFLAACFYLYASRELRGSTPKRVPIAY